MLQRVHSEAVIAFSEPALRKRTERLAKPLAPVHEPHRSPQVFQPIRRWCPGQSDPSLHLFVCDFRERLCALRTLARAEAFKFRYLIRDYGFKRPWARRVFIPIDQPW